MIKKYNKILFTTLLFFLLLFCINITTVSAKEVTLDELAEKVIEEKPDTTYVYVIGQYAFTSEHILTTQDIMLAARTIKVSENSGATNRDAIYDEMTIMYLEGVYDRNWNLIGLKYVSNLVGTTQPKEKYDIKYIDYDGKVFSKINLAEITDAAFNSIDQTALAENLTLAKEGNKVTVTFLKNDLDSLEALEGTGIATIATNLLNEYGIKSVTLGGTVEINKENLLSKLGELKDLLAELGTTSGELAGKELTAEVTLEDGCTTEDNRTFTIAFEKEVIDVADMADEAFNSINQTPLAGNITLAKDGNTVTLTFLKNDVNLFETFEGTGIVEIATNLLDEYGIKSVTIGGVEVNKENLLSKLGELADLVKDLGTTPEELAGKEITAEVTLEAGCTTEDNRIFTLAFEREVIDVADMADEAFNSIDQTALAENLTLAKEGNTVTVTFLKNDLDSLEALEGTGIATIATNLLNEYGIKSVILGGTVEISKENLLSKLGEIKDLLEELGTTSGELAGKTLTAEVTLEDGCITLDNPVFTVEFKKEVVELEDLVDEAFNSIDQTALAENLTLAKEGNTVTVTFLKNDLDSLEALEGTGIATIATNLLNEYGIKSVILGGTVEISKENLLSKLGEIKDLLEELGTTSGELAGKSLTAEVTLEDGCTTLDNPVFTVEFKKEVVELEDLVDEAFNSIDQTALAENLTLAKDGNTVTLTFLKNDVNLFETFEGTGIVEIATNLLDEYGIKSVTIGGVEVNKENLLSKLGELADLVKDLGTTPEELAGKEITAEVTLEAGCTTEDNKIFTLAFEREVIDIADMADEAFNSIDQTALAENLTLAKEGNTVTLTFLKNDVNLFETFEGTGIVEIATNLLDEYGIKSVTLGGTVEINKENLLSKLGEIKDLLEDLGTTSGELAGKSLTAEVTLEDGCITLDNPVFTIAFEN